jgi:hypothetical protein
LCCGAVPYLPIGSHDVNSKICDAASLQPL